MLQINNTAADVRRIARSGNENPGEACPLCQIAARSHGIPCETARCGLLLVDLDSGDAVEWVRIEGVIREPFDVAVLPGVKCPSAIGLKGSEVLRVISLPEGDG